MAITTTFGFDPTRTEFIANSNGKRGPRFRGPASNNISRFGQLNCQMSAARSVCVFAEVSPPGFDFEP